MSSSRAAAMRWGNGCGVGGDDDGKTQIRNWLSQKAKRQTIISRRYRADSIFPRTSCTHCRYSVAWLPSSLSDGSKAHHSESKNLRRDAGGLQSRFRAVVRHPCARQPLRCRSDPWAPEALETQTGSPCSKRHLDPVLPSTRWTMAKMVGAFTPDRNRLRTYR
eukprot:2911994-Rhodomonas_salina.1